MRDWKGEIREAIAGANLKADAAREEAVVEELAQDLTERYEDLVREGVEEAEALRRLRWWRFCRWHWELERMRRFSSCWTRCCCGRCRWRRQSSWRKFA